MKADLSLQESDAFSKDSLRRIRKHLGSDLVLLGSYVALGSDGGSSVRLNVRLQDAVSGDILLSGTHTGTETALFDLVASADMRVRENLKIPQASPTDAGTLRTSLPSLWGTTARQSRKAVPPSNSPPNCRESSSCWLRAGFVR
jgi:hypothetical protein